MKEGSITSFFVHPKPFSDQGCSLNPKCVDEVFLALENSSGSITV